MEALTQFRTIDELLRALDREKKLLQDMFERRKSLNYRTDYALVMVEYKRERIRYLIDHGVIHENGDFMELEDVYSQFFEEVLDMNEEINVASVQEYINSLREKAHKLFRKQNTNQEIIEKLVAELTAMGFVELVNAQDATYKVTSAFNYATDLVDLINIYNEEDGQE